MPVFKRGCRRLSRPPALFSEGTRGGGAQLHRRRLTGSYKDSSADAGGQVAQSVEQRTENPCVECSIHSLPTKKLQSVFHGWRRATYFAATGGVDGAALATAGCRVALTTGVASA